MWEETFQPWEKKASFNSGFSHWWPFSFGKLHPFLKTAVSWGNCPQKRMFLWLRLQMHAQNTFLNAAWGCCCFSFTQYSVFLRASSSFFSWTDPQTERPAWCTPVERKRSKRLGSFPRASDQSWSKKPDITRSGVYWLPLSNTLLVGYPLPARATTPVSYWLISLAALDSTSCSVPGDMLCPRIFSSQEPKLRVRKGIEQIRTLDVKWHFKFNVLPSLQCLRLEHFTGW